MNHTRDRRENYYIAGWSVRDEQDESFYERSINQAMEYICKKQGHRQTVHCPQAGQREQREL